MCHRLIVFDTIVMARSEKCFVLKMNTLKFGSLVVRVEDTIALMVFHFKFFFCQESAC